MNIETMTTELEMKKSMLPGIILYENREKLIKEITALATAINDYNIIVSLSHNGHVSNAKDKEQLPHNMAKIKPRPRVEG